MFSHGVSHAAAGDSMTAGDSLDEVDDDNDSDSDTG